MAEIKSTLDLIMEKTAGLVMSEADKKKAAAEEREKRAGGVALRLLEGTLRLKDLEAEIAKAAGEDREMFARLVGARLIEEADLGREAGAGPSLEEALPALFPEQAQRLRALLAETRQRYLRQAAELEETERQRVLDELKNRGIYGSAIRPVVQAVPDQAPFKEELMGLLGG